MIIYGKQVCLYVLEKHSKIINEIYFGKEIDKALFSKFASLNKPIIKPDSKKLQSLSKGGNHQGFLLDVDVRDEFDFNFFKGCSRIIVLVGVTDVGNIGSIFRSALSFGIDGIIITNTFNQSGVARSSSGAFFDMPYMVYKNPMTLINELKYSDFKLFGSSPNESKSNNSYDSKWALFLGSEGEGLPNKIIKKMDSILSIRMNKFNSLNISVAAGILMYRMVDNAMY